MTARERKAAILVAVWQAWVKGRGCTYRELMTVADYASPGSARSGKWAVRQRERRT